MAVRTAVEHDVDAILALWRIARGPRARRDEGPAIVRSVIESGSLLVAEDGDDGMVVGTLIAAWDGWRGNMYRLAVAEEHRRHGVARELVAAGERLLEARGARRITALVPREDAPATGFWRAAGYARDAVWARHVKNLP